MWTRSRKWKPPFLPALIAVLLASKIRTFATAEPDPEITYTTSPTMIEFFIVNQDFKISSVTCKSVKGVYNGSQPNTCENLEPCTTYLATIVILPVDDDDAQGGTDQTLSVNTTYALPEVALIGIEPEKYSMQIQWTAKNPSCISKFEVTVKSAEQEFKNSVQNNEESIKVNGLYPCQTYDVQLVTKDIDLEIIGEPIEMKATTDYDEPGDVTGIEFEFAEDYSVMVSWSPPTYKTCIEFYYLKWATISCIEELNSKTKQLTPQDEQTTDETLGPDDEAACKWNTKTITDTNTKEHLIRNLDGCEDYGLIFFINNEAVPKSELNAFTSPEQVPGAVEIENHVISSTNIDVAWKEPTLNRKCVQEYSVKLSGPLQMDPELQNNYQTITSEISAQFDSLDPCGEYNISIYAISLNGSAGAEVSSTVSTSEDSPTKIRNVQVEAKPKALVLQWDPPDFAELCLEGYRITGWYLSSTVSAFDRTTNNTNIVVDELISCQVYTVQIIPFTKSMDGVLMQIEQVTSPIVAAAPEPFQDIALNSHSMELSARVRDDDYFTNKCQTLFARFECETSKNVPYKKAIQYVEGQVGDVSFRAVMRPLSPFTDYVCKVDLYNTAGWSAYTEGIFVTDKYYPEEPVNVTVKSLSTSSIRFQWEAPQYSNGIINVYILYFRRVQAAYYIPPYCSSQTIEVSNPETSKFEAEFASLQPYSYYSVQIAAQNEYGTGDFTLPIIERTLPSVSGSVINLKVVSINGPDVTSATFKAYVVLSWQMPCKSNGEIDNFQVEFLGTRSGYDSVSFVRSVEPRYDDNGMMSLNETDLKPEYLYEVYVSVVNKDVWSRSETMRLSFQAPSGIPDRIVDTSSAKVDVFEAKNPTTSAVVSFPVDLLNSDSGTILYAALLLSQKSCNSQPELLVGALDSSSDWPKSASWMETYIDEECIRQYQTTPVRWQPTQTRSGAVVEYTIGTDSCSNASKPYCNGPLRADTEYQMVIRLFTKSSYSDAAILEFKTDSLIKLTLILITIISCLLVAFIAGFLYLYITKKITWHRESGQGIADSSGDVTSKNFAIFYADISKRDKLQREFKELTVIATDLTFSASEANEYKNRYRDIFPYDKNRVILDVDADGNDYINASFINGYRRKKEYIATQGPKQESVVDFWRMVLQHNVRIIVMVTQFKEEDVIKCHHYYPWEWKDLKVEIQREDFFDLYDRREMIVTHAKQNIRRKIVHFYFKKWPDHGVPEDPMSLITFVRKVKAEKCPSDSPIVVHCSAGVGRTGTFIGLDIIMQRLKSESKINIFETVKELRFQRMKMVQSMQQYTFLYTCTYQLVMHKRGKHNNEHKKVSFENNQDHGLGDMRKIGVADAESGTSFKTKNLESIL